MAAQIVVAVVYAALITWFWPHCAAPCLRANRARPIAIGVVLGLSVVAVVASLLTVPLLVGDRRDAAFAVWSIPGILWLVVVGFGFLTGFGLLIRITGGPASGS
jgi:hypothetical protein